MEIKATVQNGEIIFDEPHKAQKWLSQHENKKVVVSITKDDKTRTNAQNRALHLSFKQIADTLNGFGLDMRTFIKEGIEIPWTGETVKEYIWRPTMKTMLNKKSTTQLKTHEIDQIFEVVARVVRDRTGEAIEFPCIDRLIN